MTNTNTDKFLTCLGIIAGAALLAPIAIAVPAFGIILALSVSVLVYVVTA
jgi:hypothetical protein